MSKFSKEELKENRERYLQGRSGDLTRFAAMLGDSFESKIDWLAQLIGTAHDPSLGQYKENLLRAVIRDFIPKRYEVGTGNVLPHDLGGFTCLLGKEEVNLVSPKYFEDDKAQKLTE